MVLYTLPPEDCFFEEARLTLDGSRTDKTVGFQVIPLS